MTTEVLESPRVDRRHWIVRWYVGSAIMLLNLAILFVVVNLAIGAVLLIRQSTQRPEFLKYPDFWYRKVYSGMDDGQWKELVRETKDRPFKAEPYMIYGEPEFHGQYVSVSAEGFRIGPDQGPWPMDPKSFNVLFFGGSTGHGYGVADDQTIPANLQGLMQNKSQGQRVCVYNFAQRGYLSTQERILFEQLLQGGARPNEAIFLDGLNDFEFGVEPAEPAKMQADLNSPETGTRQLLGFLESLPIGEVAQRISEKVASQAGKSEPDVAGADASLIEKYVWNKRAIEAVGNAFGVSTVFIFQPVPVYEYDLSTHLLKIGDWNEYGDKCVIQGYPMMADYVAHHDMGSDFLWLAGVQDGVHDLLYVDKWHYSADFSKEIAGRICEVVQGVK